MITKCEICNSQKGKRNCYGTNRFVCSQCCAKTRDLHFCNTECSFFPKEDVKEGLLQKGFELTEVMRGITQRFDEPLFLPNIYDLITCNVKNLNISVVDFNKVIIDMEFNLSASREIEKEIYLKDSWKVREGSILDSVGHLLAPLIMIYSNKTGTSKLVDNKYSYNNCDIEEIKTSYNYSIWLPYSKPGIENVLAKDMSNSNKVNEVKCTCINGKHFFKKNDVFWGKLYTKYNYKFSIEIEYSNIAITDDGKLILPFGYLLPYKNVNIENYSFSNLKGMKICDESSLNLLIPSEKKVPKLTEIPLSSNDDAVEYSGYCKHLINSLESKYYYDRILINDYLCFIRINQDICVSKKYETNNIVTAYFNNIKAVYGKDYSQLKIIVANTSNDIQKINVSYSIENISEKNIENIFIKPKNVVEIPLFPTIRELNMSNNSELFVANLNVKVKYDNKSIFEESTPFNILPKETFIYDSEDDGKKGKINFYSMLARWVTPNIKEIEDIINKIARKLNSVSGFSKDMGHNYKEIEQIYNVVSEDIKYICRTFSLFKGTTALHQKIYLPQNTIKNKGGNCIDLTILLASCLEKLNYSPMIILIPGHAFLGVELNDKLLFIESTFLGYNSFQESIDFAYKNFYKYFDENLNPREDNRNFSHVIVKVNDARKIGIFPMI